MEGIISGSSSKVFSPDLFETFSLGWYYDPGLKEWR
jgi:hypothetical protein